MPKKVFRYSPNDAGKIQAEITTFILLLIKACATIRIDHEFFDHGIVDVEVQYYIVEDTITSELHQLINSFE